MADGTTGTSITTVNDGARRRPGRLPGSPRVPGSGRKPGSGNHVHAGTKITARSLLDTRGHELIARLIHVAMGRKMRVGAGPNPIYFYPSEAAQLRALDILTRKLLPDLAAQTTELTGKNGERLFGADIGSAMIARALLLAAQREQPGNAEVTDALAEMERVAPMAKGIRPEDLALVDGKRATSDKVDRLLGVTPASATDADEIAADPLNGSAVVNGFEHSWSTGSTLPQLPPLPKTQRAPEPGFVETLANGRALISFEETLRDGRERWGVRDASGMLHDFVDEGHDVAKERALGLVAAGKFK